MSKTADATVDSSTTVLEDKFYPDAKAEPSPASSETPAKDEAGAVKTEVAPEPTEEEQDPEGKGKSPRSSWAEMRAARYRAEAERDFLKQQLDEQRKAASLPAKAVTEEKPTSGKPKLSDFTDKIGSQFSTYEDAQEAYQDARDTWNRSDWEQKETEKQRLAKEEAEKKQLEEAGKTQKAKWEERAAITRANPLNKDFDTVAYSDKVQITPAMHAFLMKSQIGPDVLLAQGRDLKENARIVQLDPIEQIVELTKIETALLAKAEASKGSIPKVTQAPRPAVDVAGVAAGGVRELSMEDRFYGKK